mgnify:FL=1
MIRLPELLAPAGSPQALHSAIAAGADAVYLSGKRFGARKFAANFDHKAMTEAIDYAHLRGVKVYVTVNTLIREEELLDLAEYLVQLYDLGADAILLQDLGAASLASRLVPDLERHASTQMTIHNLPGALYAAQGGFNRVVLAREVTIEEIKRWGQKMEKAGLGLEVFVHGALCYSYSGQCLLSSAIGGRSGNRGMCAQPCRKPYVLMHGRKDEYGRPEGLQAVAQKESYIISTRDLCVYRHLDKIVRSPVQSLKIEGRMKSPQYVAIVTSIYRRALDAIARGSWSPSKEDERDLALAFNRDFTTGHLLGAKDVMGRGMSDNQGVLIGSVASYDPQRGEAAVRLCASLVPEKGDGLVFQSPGQEMGLVVQKAIEKDGLVRLRTPDRVRPGARVFLTGSTALARRAEEIAARERASIPVNIRLTWEDGIPVAEGRLDSGELAVARGESRMGEAVNRPLTPEQIESQMRKTGGTPFVARRVEMDYPGGLFSPPGALNQLRRDLLAGLEKALLERRRPPSDRIREAKDRLQKLELPARRAGEEWSRPKLSVYADRLDILKGAVDGGSRRIYFEPLMEKGRGYKDRKETILAQLLEAKKLCCNTELIWKWPRITRDDFIDLALPLLSEVQVNGIMVENVGPAWAIKEKMPEMPIYGGSGLNVWNHLTAQALAPQFCWLTLSPELSRRQLKDAVSAIRALPDRDGTPNLELVVQGSLEVMVAEDSIPQLAKGSYSDELWGLQDFKHIFPLWVDDEGRTHIFNSAETCLIDLLPEICRIGLDGVSLDARGRTESYAREMTGAYNLAIELTERLMATDPAPLKEELLDLKERILPLALGGITHGHFLRGLKD